jgi:hypothetical protein
MIRLTELIVRQLTPDHTLDDVPLKEINGLLTFVPAEQGVYFFRTRRECSSTTPIWMLPSSEA